MIFQCIRGVDNRVKWVFSLLVFFGLSAMEAKAQTQEGDWYITWGYNRSMYTSSDVHMWGMGPGGAFDLTLHDAQASDMPERFQAKVYFHPGLFTIPQYNARFGKKISEKWWISVGWDHMKYKLRKQFVKVSGFASASDMGIVSPVDPVLEYDNEGIYWSPEFNLEHSDGMNFVRFSLEREWDLWAPKRAHIALSGFAAAGAGLVVCSTDFRWADVRQKNAQHISGLGLGFHSGLRMQVHRRFFVQTTAHVGGVTLPWIRVQGPGDAGAQQSIGYFEGAFALGYLIGGDHRNQKKGCNTCPKWGR
jgi:hypothetical protein